MPDDIRAAGALPARLALLEHKLAETVRDFCADRDGEELPRFERTARTLASLMRESERMEEMKRKYERAGSDQQHEFDPAEIERMRAEIKRRLDRIAESLVAKQVGGDADARPDQSPDD